MRKVISNTSCLIALSNIGELGLLERVYGDVWITPEVASEFGETIPSWMRITPVADKAKVKLIANTLDLGESSTIALAMEQEESLLILDDGKARRFAENLGLVLTGTLGVIVKAKQQGEPVDLKNIIARFRQCGFRIPNNIESVLNSL
jgi:predicted nucleic acid-binding protein